MGNYYSTTTLTSDDKDKAFLHEECHKTYVVTTPGCNFVKVGYTKRTLNNGVWKAYRRAYGNDMIIIRVYKAKEFKEDEKIHKALHGTFGDKNKGREIYDKKKLKKLLLALDIWHCNKGSGEFTKADIKYYNKKYKTKKDEDVIIEGIKFLKL